MIRHLFLFFLVAMSFSCDQFTTEQKKSKKGVKDGLVKQYWPGGKLKTEINFKDGKQHGLAKRYYKDGNLRQQIDYVNGKKHGTAITYYQNGIVYQKTPYVNGLLEGIRLKYRENGKLMAEIPYQEGQPCRGLKEYLLDGSPKKKYPSIRIQEVDNLLKNGEFSVIVKMSDGTRKVDFYVNVPFADEGCLPTKALSRSNYKPGVMKLDYHLPENAFIMETLEIIAVATTTLGNPYVTSTTHNLAIENRGF